MLPPPRPGILAGIAPWFYSLPAAVVAHTGPAPVPATLWSSWGFDLLVVVPLVLAAALYARGVSAVWRRSGRGRVVPAARVLAFGAGVAAVAVAVASPLDVLATALFSAHMVQHLLLTVVAAPLLVVGTRWLVVARALPPVGRRAAGRLERRLVGARPRRARAGLVAVAIAAATVTFWAWHAPVLYEAAVQRPWVHAVEHLTMLATAVGLWWAVVAAARRGGVLVAVAALLLASIQGVALAALITLAPSPWYGVHAGSAVAWGLTAAGDQQLAGALMWTVGGLAHLAGIAVLLHRRLDTASGPGALPRPLVPGGAPG